jgi:hypothetical protein
MGYQMQNGRYANTLPVHVMGGVVAVTTNGAAVELGDRGSARLDLKVTASSGDTSQTLDVKIQTSPDGATWSDVASFTQVTTATGSQHKVFTGLDRFVRAVATVGGTGTPSFTFTVDGEAV